MATQAPAYSQPGYPPIGQDPPPPQYPPAGPPPAQYPPAGPPPAQYPPAGPPPAQYPPAGPPPAQYPPAGPPPAQYPPAGYPPQPQPPTVVVVNAGSHSVRFSNNPMNMTCPNCHSQILTSVTYENGTMTWVICLVLFFFTAICCFIPFLVDGCKDAIHSCPSCNRMLGRKNGM
ncbi:cell death-inducing p53-target protein 1 homolog [Bolinopsis microptera]|uniref:cell death-inducing p53-target protein 1 homolog n=1 Tax=Bolinopsis microptera TaxID=2820187 RepID=UPI00307A18C8